MLQKKESLLKRDTPVISVLMGIYNCENTLEEAVECIRKQTYPHWELILCDDGSKDDTYVVAKRLADKDKRIIVLKNERNRGLNRTLNRCLCRATGDFIARMDGDDRCEKDRFEKQLSFLLEQEKYQIVSSRMYFFDESGVYGQNQVKQYPTKKDVLTNAQICHAPVMMWKKCIDDVGGYTEDNKMLRVEDVNLWIKLYAKGYQCYNIQEPLYGMRNDKNALNRRRYRFRINETYVRILGCKQMKAPLKYYILACKPLIAGLVPAKIRFLIRRKQWGHER